MKIKYYCIIALGGVDMVSELVKRVSDSNPRILQQKGVVIATTSTVFTISELMEIFKLDDCAIFIYEVNDETSGQHISRKHLQSDLFDYIEKEKLEKSKSENEFSNAIDLTELIDKVKSMNINHNMTRPFNKDKAVDVDNKLSNRKKIIDVNTLSYDEIRDKIDNLLDKGVSKLNTNERTLLENLTKSLNSK